MPSPTAAAAAMSAAIAALAPLPAISSADPRVDATVRLLGRATGLSLPQAMRAQGFRAEDSSDRTKQMWIRRRLERGGVVAGGGGGGDSADRDRPDQPDPAATAGDGEAAEIHRADTAKRASDPRVARAVRLLEKHPGLSVPKAMRAEGFTEEDCQDRAKQMWVRRRLGKEAGSTRRLQSLTQEQLEVLFGEAGPSSNDSGGAADGIADGDAELPTSPPLAGEAVSENLNSTENYLGKAADGIVDGNAKLPTRQTRPPPAGKADSWYYAVRVGYARAAKQGTGGEEGNSDREDGRLHSSKSNKKRKRGRPRGGKSGKKKGDSTATAPVVEIRSAIFLSWEDALPLVGGPTPAGKKPAEYAALPTFDEAARYLIAGGARRDSFGGGGGAAKEAAGAAMGGTKGGTTVAAAAVGGKKPAAAAPPNATGKEPPQPKEDLWETMYNKLVEYKDANDGSMDIELTWECPDNLERNELRRWCESQRQQQRRWSLGHTNDGRYHWSQRKRETFQLTPRKLQKLRDFGFPLPPSYEEMYQKLARHKADTGTLDVSKDDDEELFKWTTEQRRMLNEHFQGRPVPLTDERIQNLRSLGFENRFMRCNCHVVDTGLEEKKWDAKLADLVAHRNENGTLACPKDSSVTYKRHVGTLEKWLATQRREFRALQQGKESTLTARRLERLTAEGIDMTPRDVKPTWEERMQSLRKFVEENGHCRPRKDTKLGIFCANVRTSHKKREEGRTSGLTDERVNDLLELGFEFQIGQRRTLSVRKGWEERFQDLQAFHEKNGHTLVTKSNGDHYLATWVRDQRCAYKRMKRGQKTHMNPEKALRLSELGFQFDATKCRPEGSSEEDAEGEE